MVLLRTHFLNLDRNSTIKAELRVLKIYSGVAISDADTAEGKISLDEVYMAKSRLVLI